MIAWFYINVWQDKQGRTSYGPPWNYRAIADNAAKIMTNENRKRVYLLRVKIKEPQC